MAILQSAVGSWPHSDDDDNDAETPAGAVDNGDAEVKNKKPKASLGDLWVEELWVAVMSGKCLWLLMGLRVIFTKWAWAYDGDGG